MASTDKEYGRAMSEISRPPNKPGEPPAGDPESSGGGLWNAIRKLFEEDDTASLREQLEEVIDEHEGEQAGADAGAPKKGDLSAVELTMLRNLLHFSENDADDVAIPRGEIIAISASSTWAEVIAQFTEHGHSRLPIYRDQLDDIVGMIHIKDVFNVIAAGEPAPEDWTVLMRQPLYVPQARSALDVLADMRARGQA